MANTIGGKILLGVRDDGTVIGVKGSNELRARIQDVARNCDPPVKVLVEPVGNVLAVQVRESDAKPVQCNDGFFWRQGAVTQKLSRDEIRDFFHTEGSIRFDLSPCSSFRYPQDFDKEKFNAWLRLSGITGRPRTEDVLVNIEAAERAGGKLLFRNAGVLFFAKNELRRRRNEKAFLFDKDLSRCLGRADREDWELAISMCSGNVAEAARECGLSGVPRDAKALCGRSEEEALGTYRRWQKRRRKQCQTRYKQQGHQRES